MATLRGIAIKSRKRADVTTLGGAVVHPDYGVAGDFRGAHAKPDRKVTILLVRAWADACRKVGQTPDSLPWTTRRANLLVESCLTFVPTDIGKLLHVGPHVILEITGETEPCKRMDEAYPGLMAALTPGWRGGATCRVVRGGWVSLGNHVHFP